MNLDPAIKKAVVEEGLKLSSLFRNNALLKHGITPNDGLTRLDEAQTAPAPEPTVKSELTSDSVIVTLLNRLGELEKRLTTKDSPSPVSPAPSAASGLPQWAKVAAAGLIGAATTGAGVGLGSWLNSGKPEPPAMHQRDPQSVLPYLEEGGYHLPPEKKP